MQVWIVVDEFEIQEYSKLYEIYAVFSTKEKAEAYKEEKQKELFVSLKIIEREVDAI